MTFRLTFVSASLAKQIRSALVLLILVGVACGSPPQPSGTQPSGTASGSQLTVRVMDKSGNSIVGATVTIITGSYAGESKVTDNTGVAVFTDITTLGFMITATSPGHQAAVALVEPPDRSILLVLTYDAITLTGLVTSAETSAPLAGATVYLNGRYRATTDGSGHYSIAGILDLPSGDNVAWAFLDGYEETDQLVMSSSLNFRLYAVQRFTVGTPVQFTVAPTDSICDNNAQDPSFGVHDYVCRSLHTTAPSDGVITVEAVSQSGEHFPLYVAAPGHQCCDLKNPATFTVKAGDVISISVELPSTSTASQTFVVTASMAGESRKTP